MSNTDFATVTEAQADAATAAIFADIRDTMGIALVNLIWRHLAVMPAALSWSWNSLKPLYTSGDDLLGFLRQTLGLPVMSAFNEQQRRAIAGIDEELGVVDAVLRTYERGNAQNLVALCVLRLLLRRRGDGGDGATAVTGAGLPTRAVAVNAVDAKRSERADRVTEALPPLPAMAELSAEIRADIESLAEVWVPARHRGMIPSVFRHLAHWPVLLAIYRDKSHALSSTPHSIPELAASAIDEATRHAAALIAQLAPPAPLAVDTHAWLAAALDLFIDAMIGRGTVIVPAMRKVLPRRNL